MDSDEQNNFYFHTPHSLPSSSHSSSSYGHSYTPLQGGFNHSRSSLEPIAQPFPTRHGHLWPHSTTPTERSWTSSPLTDGITSAGPRNTTQFQSSLLSEEVQKKLDRARERITYLEGQLETITYVKVVLTRKNVLTLCSASFNKVIDKVPELLRLETPRPDAKFAVMAALGQRPKKRNAEDYPDVRFWTLASWKKYQEMRKGISNSEKLTNHFLEDEDGRALDKHQVESIHKVAFSLWFMVRDAKRLPVTWGVAAADVSDFFRDEMVRRCPDMLLCEDDWKTTYLATQIYSSWKRSHGTKKVKEEAGEMSIAEEQKPGLSKRKVEDPVTGNLIVPSKKPKQSKETVSQRSNSHTNNTDKLTRMQKPAALVPTSVPTQSISLLKSNTLTDGTGKPAATAQHVQTTASVDNASAPTTVGRPTPRRLQVCPLLRIFPPKLTVYCSSQELCRFHSIDMIIY